MECNYQVVRVVFDVYWWTGIGAICRSSQKRKLWKSLNTGNHLLIHYAMEFIEDSVSRPCEPCFIIVSGKIHSQWCVIDVTTTTGQKGPEEQMESRGTVYSWQMHKTEKLITDRQMFLQEEPFCCAANYSSPFIFLYIIWNNCQMHEGATDVLARRCFLLWGPGNNWGQKHSVGPSYGTDILFNCQNINQYIIRQASSSQN